MMSFVRDQGGFVFLITARHAAATGGHKGNGSAEMIVGEQQHHRHDSHHHHCPFPSLLTYRASSFATTSSATSAVITGAPRRPCPVRISHDGGSETCRRSRGSSTTSGTMARIARLEGLLDIVSEYITVQIPQPSETIYAIRHTSDCARDLDSVDPPAFADRAGDTEIAETRIVRYSFAVALQHGNLPALVAEGIFRQILDEIRQGIQVQIGRRPRVAPVRQDRSFHEQGF